MADSFEQFIASSGDLSLQRGRIAPRNAFMAEFVHKFDLHFAQDFFLNIGGRRHTLQLNADIINLGNLLNRGWGMSPYIQYDNITPIAISTDRATGKSVYSFTHHRSTPWDYADINSRWRAQIGVKYTF